MPLQIFDPANYTFSLYAIPTFATGAAILFLGLLVLVHERRSPVSVLFFLVTLTTGIWLFGTSWAYCSTNEQAALWWLKAAHLGMIFIPALIYHFTVTTMRVYQRCKKPVWISWMLSALFFAAIVGTDTFIGGLNHYGWGYYSKYGWLSIPFLIFFLVMVVASLRHYWIEYRKADPGIHKARSQSLMIAFSVGCVGSFDYLAAYGVPLYPFGYLPVFAFLVMTARAIWSYRLADITSAFAVKEIINAMADALFVLDHDGVVRIVNQAACQLLGKTERELVGAPITTITSAISTPERLDTLMLGGSIRDYEISLPARQDGITTLSVSSFVICDQNQQPVATLCIMRDSTERKRAEGQIQHHRERQAALYDIDLAIISTLDLRVVLDILLEKINDLLVYSHAASVSLINRDTGELEPIAARNFDEEEWKTEKLKSGRGLSNIVFETKAPMMVRNAQTDPRTRDPQFFRKHGLVSYLGVPLTAKGEVLGVLSLYTKEEHELSNEEIDFLTTLAGRAAIVIHNCQLYEQTKNQAIELEKTNRTKSEFLSIMSHELRTPLATIMGYTRTVQDKMLGSINQEQEWALGKVTKHSHELLTMINSIMEATKIEAGGITVESQAVNLGDFLNDLTLAYEIPFSKELTLTWNYPPDLPTLHTDKGKLRQILQNLINNGIKFTEKGNVTLSASYFPGAKTVEFKVSDTGIGIPRETIPVIFDRFRQLDSSVTRSYGGVGLGLYIVTTFTNMLGGKIEVESEPGKGSTFTVTFPLNLEEVRAQEDLSASPVASKNNKP